MGILDEKTIGRITSLLKHHQKGLMISDLSSMTKINRNIMAKYLEILQMSGQVEMAMRGNAKVYTLSKRAPLSALFESSSDCIILLDGERKILRVNAPVMALTGKDAGDFAGKTLSDIDDPLFAALPHGEGSGTAGSVSEISCLRAGEPHYYRVRQIPAVLADGSNGSILSCEDVTTEVVFQQMVELSEARFRAIVEDQTEFIARFLPDGSLSFVNGSFARAAGKKPEELVGTQFFLHIHADDVPAFKEKLQATGPDNAVVTLRCRGIGAGGQVRRLQWTVRALFDKENRLSEYQAVGRDITEQAEAVGRLRRHAEETEFIARKIRRLMELSKDADLYAAIAEDLSEMLPDKVIAVSSITPSAVRPGWQDLTIRNVCGIGGRELFREISGIDLVGFTYSFNDPAAVDYIKREGLHKAFGDLYTCLFGQIPFLVCRQIEDAINLGDTHIHALVSEGQLIGEVAIYSRKGDTITNPGLVEAFIRQASLVLAWRMANESLQKSEAQFRAIVEEQTESIVRFLPDGTLTFVNECFARSAGRSPEELAGTSFFLRFDEQDAPGFSRQIRSMDPDHAVVTSECRGAGNGEKRLQQWTVRALFDREDRPSEYLGVGRDITEQAEAVGRLRRHAGELEFITRKAREFLELPPEADLYTAIGESLSELVPDVFFQVCSFDSKSKELSSRYLYGEPARETFRRIAGFDLVGYSFIVNDPAAIGFLRENRLEKAFGDLYTAFFGRVPYLVCKQLEEELGLDEIYVLGLVSHGELFGCVAILPKKGSKIPNPGLVEAFLQQASLVLAWKRTDEALRKSEARFRAIVEDQTEFIARFLPEGTLTYVNRSYARYLGKEPQELNGQPHIPYIVNEVIPALLERYDADSPDSAVMTVQCRAADAAGNPRWHEWTVRALPGAQGAVAEFQGVGRDITELHEASESTRQHVADMEFLSRKAREFLELPPGTDIYNAIMYGLRELAPDSTITICSFNPHASALVGRGIWPEDLRTFLIGVAGGDFIGRPFFVRDPEVLSNWKAGRIIRIPGDLYSIMFGMIPITISQQIEEKFSMGGDKFSIGLVSHDRILGAVLIIPRDKKPLPHRDLIETYLQQAAIALAQRVDADALRQSEERFRSVIENQTEFVTRFLPDGTLTFVNTPLCRALGKSPEEVLGRSFFSMILDDDLQILMAGLASMTAENPSMTTEQRFFIPDGRTRWFQWTNRATFDERGQVVEYDGIGRDITELHEAAERIRRHPADIRFLTRNAWALAGSRNEETILSAAARGIRSIVPDAMVGVCWYDHGAGSLSFRCLEGSPEDISAISHELRQDPAKTAFAFPADKELLSLFSGKRLSPAPGHIGFLFRSVSPDICNRIGERCNFGRSYVMGLPSQDGTTGAVLVQLKAGADLKNPELVEAVIAQAGLALAGIGGEPE